MFLYLNIHEETENKIKKIHIVEYIITRAMLDNEEFK